MFTRSIFIAVVLFSTSFCLSLDAQSPTTKSQRAFKFKYAAKVSELPANSQVKVWFPIAAAGEFQKINGFVANTPSPLQINKDAKHGNQIGFFEIVNRADQNSVGFDANYEVIREEAGPYGSKSALAPNDKQVYLAANSLVPIDGDPIKLLDKKELPKTAFEKGEFLYNTVESWMKYDKSKPGYGKGDSVWACNSRTGNCTDFHSLFISLARNQSIPAKFEIGFPLPPNEESGTVGGYHCWAWFHAEDHGWVPVDISEADKHPEMKSYYFGKLTADRIAFTRGRDIELVPAANQGPLNYFVYPVVEVNGKPWPKEKIQLEFSFSK